MVDGSEQANIIDIAINKQVGNGMTVALENRCKPFEMDTDGKPALSTFCSTPSLTDCSGSIAARVVEVEASGQLVAIATAARAAKRGNRGGECLRVLLPVSCKVGDAVAVQVISDCVQLFKV